MSLPSYKITLTDAAGTTLYTIQGQYIDSISDISSVDIIGSELAIDKLICSVTGTDYDYRTLPFGTTVTLYRNNARYAVYYFSSVRQFGREAYELTCVSMMGVLDKRWHPGGVYYSVSLASILASILSPYVSNTNYAVDSSISSLLISGYLPYDKARANLHRVLMAYGVIVGRTSTGLPYFTRLATVSSGTIPPDRIWAGGSISYDAPASRIELTEHAYLISYVMPIEDIADLSNAAVADHMLIQFSQPYASLSGVGLTIHQSAPNYAIVSGRGVLSGRPYAHFSNVVARDNPNAYTERTVKISDNGMISISNSKIILDRLASYYFDAHIVDQPMELLSERCGALYNLQSPFLDSISAYLAKADMTRSGIDLARCQLVAGFTPPQQHAQYTRVRQIQLSPGGSSTVAFASFAGSVRQYVRLVLIGKGQDGEDGEPGGEGGSSRESSAGRGGRGGRGGTGGRGGRVLLTGDIDVTAITSVSVSWPADSEDVICTIGDASYTSADGVRITCGYADPVSGILYAADGENGIDGGDGGDGISGDISRYEALKDLQGGHGSDVSNGVSPANVALYMYGGTGSSGGYNVVQHRYVLGCGGGGASASGYGVNGGADGKARGKGAAAADKVYDYPMGYGGSGGNGGGGGGGGGASFLGSSPETWYETPGGYGGSGGKASPAPNKAGGLVYY